MSDTGAHHLGKRRLKTKNSTKIDLQVKLRNESQPRSILAVFLTYLTTSFPDFLSRCVKIPQFFSYKLKKGIQGFPSLGLVKVGKDWSDGVRGMVGEEKVFNSLRDTFKNRTSLLLQGFELSNMLKLAKEQQGESETTVQLTSYDKNLGEMLAIDLHAINFQAERITDFIVGNSSKNTIDLLDIESGKASIKDNQQMDRNAVKLINNIMQIQCWPVFKKDIQIKVEKEIKGNETDLISIVNRVLGSHEVESIGKELLETRGGVLKKELKTSEDALNIIEILLKQKGTLSREEVNSIAAKFLFNIKIQDNQELDTLIVDKNSKTIIQLETKVQNPENNRDKKLTAEKDKARKLNSLRNLIKGACGQIKTGRHVIENILTRGINLTGWSILTFVCLPELKDKTLLKELNIEDKFLPYFLTEKELESEELAQILGLDECRIQESDTLKTAVAESEKDEEMVADEEYTTLLAWIVGALNCTINCQTFDYSLDLDRVTKTITGDWEEAVEVLIDINNCCGKCITEIPNMVGRYTRRT